MISLGKSNYGLYVDCDKAIRESNETNNKGQGVIKKKITAFAQKLELECNE